MSAFVYYCPNMGKYVQGWTADDPYESDADAYEVGPVYRLHARAHGQSEDQQSLGSPRRTKLGSAPRLREIIEARGTSPVECPGAPRWSCSQNSWAKRERAVRAFHSIRAPRSA